MKTIKQIIFGLFLGCLLFSCEEDELENLREATFSMVFLNSGTQACNEAQLTFQVLFTFPNGRQETHTIAPFNEFQKTLSLVRDRESINIKVFFPSSEDPISEANIPFIFSNLISDEQLEPPGNELLIQYCHGDDNRITWDTFYE